MQGRITGKLAERTAALPRAARHGAFAAAVLLAVLVGRSTQLPGSGFAVAWPVAGVGFLWILWAWPRRAGRSVALGGVFVLISLINMVTGLEPVLAVAGGLGGAVQGAAAAAIFSRLVPSRRVSGLGDYFRLTAAAVLAAAAAGLILLAGGFVLGAQGQLQTYLAWVVRNTVSLVAIGSFALVAVRSALRPVPVPRDAGVRTVEVVALLAATGVLYVVGFARVDPLPIAFIVIPANIWAGLRLRPEWAMAYGLGSGILLIWLTLSGRGPFHSFPPDTAAYVAQLFTFVAFSVSAVLALITEERLRLIRRLSMASREAQAATRLRDVVIEKMNDGVVVADSSGRVLLRNPASIRGLGGGMPATREEWVARYDLRAPGGSERLSVEELPLSRALTGEKVERASVELHRADGQVVRLSVDAVPLPGGQGAVAVFRNVTEERRHQDDLTRFASVAAHDLLTPLTVFDGWLEILEDDEVSDSERRGAILRLRRASQRMRSLIRGLLAYSLAEEDKIAAGPVDVAAVVAGILEMRSVLPLDTTAPAVTFHTDIRRNVFADARLFSQLLENLIGNAVKYGRKDGTAMVAVTSDEDPETGWTRVRVADNGIGVAAEEREAIFNELHRSANGISHASGTGMGLAICRRIVENHGGRIYVEDGPDGGSTFTFTLPARPEQLPAGISIAPPQGQGAGKEESVPGKGR